MQDSGHEVLGLFAKLCSNFKDQTTSYLSCAVSHYGFLTCNHVISSISFIYLQLFNFIDDSNFVRSIQELSTNFISVQCILLSKFLLALQQCMEEFPGKVRS